MQALQLLNSYGKDDDEIEEIDGTDNGRTASSFSIVDYYHEEDEAENVAQYIGKDTATTANIGRAVLTPSIPRTSEPAKGTALAEPNHQTPPQVSPLFTSPQMHITLSPPVSEINTPTHVVSPVRSNAYLPPEPLGECDTHVAEKIKNFHNMKAAGKSINDNLRKSKPFRNPDILEKLVSYCKINEIGSNYPTHIFNPSGFHREDFYDAIAAEQKRLEEKREQERATRTQIEFTTANPVRHTEAKKGQENSGNKKKSKWDNLEPVSNMVRTAEPYKKNKQ